MRLTHERPSFGIDSVEVDGGSVAVYEERVTSTPFGTLVRFERDIEASQPRVLIVPGLAGHFGTLVRATVGTLLRDHEVYVADWHNARDVPVSAGPFGLHEYIEHLMDFMAEIGPGAHLMAVCQPGVPVLAATALMAEDRNPAQARSLILMAGPVDARIDPGPVNDFATKISPKLIERTAITTVPRPHPGHGRRVYPGFVQTYGFMNMDPRRHASAFGGLLRLRLAGDEATRTMSFYDEYFTILDIAAEFYLETSRAIFRDHDLARGELRWRGTPGRPAGDLDRPSHDRGAERRDLPAGPDDGGPRSLHRDSGGAKRHHLQAVGHYGVFSGSRFEREIYPELRSSGASWPTSTAASTLRWRLSPRVHDGSPGAPTLARARLG
jgi:poly(3-hydroxybutyrate) depolymerase